MNNLYNEKIEGLISAALADGVLTEKEKQVLFKRAQAEGIDLDEFEMVLDARLVELKKVQKSAPKSEKYGDVRKCPACGAMVPSLAGVCPECGHEFSGISANLSSQKLAELLQTTFNEISIIDKVGPLDDSIDDDLLYKKKQLAREDIEIAKEENINKRKNIIETFPIPNTKSDLFEFLTSLQPRIHDIMDPLANSYFIKYEECINKVNISFANDVDFIPFIEHYKKEKKIVKMKLFFYKIFHWFSDDPPRIIAIIFFIIVLIMLLNDVF